MQFFNRYLVLIEGALEINEPLRGFTLFAVFSEPLSCHFLYLHKLFNSLFGFITVILSDEVKELASKYTLSPTARYFI